MHSRPCGLRSAKWLLRFFFLAVDEQTVMKRKPWLNELGEKDNMAPVTKTTDKITQLRTSVHNVVFIETLDYVFQH